MTWAKGSRKLQGYDGAWQRVRPLILKRDRHLCQPCLRATPQRITTANIVDHVVNKARRGTDHPSNLEAVCKTCHTAKTIVEAGHQPRPIIGLDGWPIDKNYRR